MSLVQNQVFPKQTGWNIIICEMFVSVKIFVLLFTNIFTNYMYTKVIGRIKKETWEVKCWPVEVTLAILMITYPCPVLHFIP